MSLYNFFKNQMQLSKMFNKIKLNSKKDRVQYIPYEKFVKESGEMILKDKNDNQNLIPNLQLSQQKNALLLTVALVTLVLSSVGSYLIFSNSTNDESNQAVAGVVEYNLENAVTRRKRAVDIKAKDLPEAVKIENFPLIKQEYNLSCEVTSLQMALQYFGIQKTQDELMQELGYAEPIELQQVNGEYVWGDPNLGFVGKVDGWFTGQKNGETSLKYGTGWGVNMGPINTLAKNYLANTHEMNSGDVLELRSHLAENRPVIWWHVRDDAHDEKLKYKTPDGKQFTFLQHHVNVMIGYELNQSGEYIYFFNDPYYGSFSLTETEMLTWWEKYQNHALAVWN